MITVLIIAGMFLKKLSKNYNFLTCINLTKNFGQHNAIMAGLNNAVGDCMITLDDDLQHPPEFFPEIINKLKILMYATQIIKIENMSVGKEP